MNLYEFYFQGEEETYNLRYEFRDIHAHPHSCKNSILSNYAAFLLQEYSK